LGAGRDSGRADLGTPVVTVIIPAYNEGENIAPVLRGLLTAAKSQLEVLVVHDFDGDSTVPVVEELQKQLPRVRLLHNRRGRGVLNALRAGFQAATASYVVVMMADGSDDPSAVDRMLAVAEAGADVVAASRYVPGGRQLGGPLAKRMLSRAAGLSLYWLGALPIHDATNNFRLYSRRLLREVTIESSAGFEVSLELTIKAHLLGMRVAEVPTTWTDRTAGRSQFRMWSWIPHYLRWYARALAGRLGPRFAPP
jgi:glycosyltransferase involved in cell wall biosynthesis